jgi:hypothetical protein
MKQKAYQTAFPVALAVMAVFVCTIFFANANPAFADSAKKKGDRTTAVAYTESQITQLQDSLAITPEQTVLWNNLTKVMRENAADMDAMTKERAENVKGMNALDRMKFHRQITETHLNQLKKFIPVFEALYVTMSDEQKTTTDAIFATGKHKKHKRK